MCHANLKNPWGVAFNPKGFAWVAANGTNVATLYDGNGVPQLLVVTIPNGKNGSASPTGIVFNGTQSFTVTENGKSGVAAFIFTGEGGIITAWAPTVGPTSAFVMYDDVAGAGLGMVDVYDTAGNLKQHFATGSIAKCALGHLASAR